MLWPVPAIKQVSIERVGLEGSSNLRRTDRDRVVVEAPLAVSARGQRMLIIMRTPGHDLELVAGLLHAEALPAAELRVVGSETDCIDVDLDPSCFAARALTSVAACGVCGRQTIADLEKIARSVDSDFAVRSDVVRAIPARLRQRQAVFDDTGGLHAAALCTRTGELVVVREDVGRHNAVDKVVGWALACNLTPADHLLLVSGRLGYEIVQKAVRLGVPVIVAVSAPTSLAIELAERFRVAVCAFVRGDRFNVYSHGWRIE
jgi:FdhD protein